MLTEIIDLPSKGNLYPKDHPLASGQIEIKYMTAKDEDILTTESYIKNDVVLEKLLESVIVSDDIDPMDLSVGDKQKVLLQSRILAYGSEYEFTHNGKKHTVDLTELEDKGKPELFDNDRYVDIDLKHSKKKLTIKILNSGEAKAISKELEALRKTQKTVGEITTRLFHIIEAVDGDSDAATIREFVNNELLAADSLAIRMYLDAITPDVDFSVELDSGEVVDIPIGINFLYPSAKV